MTITAITALTTEKDNAFTSILETAVERRRQEVEYAASMGNIEYFLLYTDQDLFDFRHVRPDVEEEGVDCQCDDTWHCRVRCPKPCRGAMLHWNWTEGEKEMEHWIDLVQIAKWQLQPPPSTPEGEDDLPF